MPNFNLGTRNDASIATLATPIRNDDEYNNPNVVQVVCDKDGYALYFSRSSIPFQSDSKKPAAGFALRHLGINIPL